MTFVDFLLLLLLPMVVMELSAILTRLDTIINFLGIEDLKKEKRTK